MPRKEFDAFTRLDASDVNTFLMDQSVMTFGSATARDAAIDTPLEGQVTYLADIDSLSVYNGTQWVTNRPVMSFAGTAARESAILTPVEGMTTYLEDSNILSLYDGSAWKTSLATTGSILQVVTDVEATQVSNNTNSFVTSNAQATITPKSTSSRILILVSGMIEMTQTPQSVQTAIYRGGAGGTQITDATQDMYQSTGNFFWPIGLNYLDSPNTTSATTYTLMFRKSSGIGGVNIQPSSSRTNITLLEVAG
jgi:hypothetical protein